MTSSSKKHRKKHQPNWMFMLLAVCAAVAMWYAVSIRDRIEGQVEVNIDYVGIPANLVVTSGLVPKLTVRLRGPEALLRSTLRQTLNYTINLSFIKKGVTIVPLPGTELSPKLRAFEVVDIQPPRIVVTADNLIERSVPVTTVVDSPLDDALTVENVSVSPATVILRGPEEIVSRIPDVLLTIPLDPSSAGQPIQQTMALDTPSLVTSTPSSVRVRYTITSGRTTISLTRKINIAKESTQNYQLVPDELTLLVEVPEALAKDASYLKGLQASIAPPHLEPGESKKTRPSIKLPEGMTLLDPVIPEITVTRLKH